MKTLCINLILEPSSKVSNLPNWKIETIEWVSLESRHRTLPKTPYLGKIEAEKAINSQSQNKLNKMHFLGPKLIFWGVFVQKSITFQPWITQKVDTFMKYDQLSMPWNNSKLIFLGVSAKKLLCFSHGLCKER